MALTKQQVLGFYNRDYYIQNNPDLANYLNQNPGFDLFEHYYNAGLKEGRVASPNFNHKAYLNNNPDLKAYAASHPEFNTLEHYINAGFREGRKATDTGAETSKQLYVPTPVSSSVTNNAVEQHGFKVAQAIIQHFNGIDEEDIEITNGYCSDGMGILPGYKVINGQVTVVQNYEILGYGQNICLDIEDLAAIGQILLIPMA